MRADIEAAAETWLMKHRATTDPAVLNKIIQRATELHQEQGGFFAPAHLERSYLELLNEGEIPRIKGTMVETLEADAIPPKIIAFIETASAFQLQRAYRSDPTFARFYDLWERTKKPQQQQAHSGEVVTLELYRSLPAAIIAKRYQTDSSFRAGVDDLIRRSLI